MLFVVPGPHEPISGGNRYNDALIGALGAQRIDAAALDRFPLEDARGALWVDSLYLSALPRIRARARRVSSIGLLAHSLPSLLARACGLEEDTLVEHERALLTMLDSAVAPSETMRAWLAERAPSLRVSVVPPGVVGAPPNKRDGALAAVMVANLLPNKGVLPFLETLAERVLASDRFTLRVIGRVDLDRAYAARCLALAGTHVAFTDGMPFERLLQELARAHVLVSASRIESFGMAIAEARACGCVVLARKGGHVESQLDDPVANSDAELADQLLELARDSSLLHARLARVKPPPARSWSDVAREFMRV